MRNFRNILVVSFILLFFLAITGQAIGHLKINSSASSLPFNDKQYEKTTWQEFYKLDEVNKPIDLLNPDYDLLAAAVFYATNEYRESKNLPQFKYSRDLRDAADNQAREMNDSSFFGHNNRKDTANYTPRQRIKNTGGRYFIIAENLGRIILHKINNPKDYYAMKGENIVSQTEYKYFDKKIKEELPIETYLEFGKKTIKQWLENKEYNANLHSLHFSHLACSVALPRQPFKYKKLPLGLVSATFGGYKLN